MPGGGCRAGRRSVPGGGGYVERAVSLEGVFPAGYEVRDGRGRAVADDLDEVVGSGEDAVLVVDGDVADVLDEVRGPAAGGQAGGELVDADGIVGHRDAQRPRDRFGDAVVVHLGR